MYEYLFLTINIIIVKIDNNTIKITKIIKYTHYNYSFLSYWNQFLNSLHFSLYAPIIKINFWIILLMLYYGIGISLFSPGFVIFS